jgi:hypothetical protein
LLQIISINTKSSGNTVSDNCRKLRAQNDLVRSPLPSLIPSQTRLPNHRRKRCEPSCDSWRSHADSSVGMTSGALDQRMPKGESKTKVEGGRGGGPRRRREAYERQLLALVAESDREGGSIYIRTGLRVQRRILISVGGAKISMKTLNLTWYPGEPLRRIDGERFGKRLGQHRRNIAVDLDRPGFRSRMPEDPEGKSTR